MPNPQTLTWKPWRPMGHGRYLPTIEIPEEGTSLDGIEKELIEVALRQSAGNQTQAARLLGISRDTLRYRIKKFDLVKDSRHKSLDAESNADDSNLEPGSLNAS